MGNRWSAESRVGALLAVCGGLSVGLGIAGVVAYPWSIFHLLCAPIGSGGMVFLTGCMGLSCWNKPADKWKLVAFVTLGVTSGKTALIQSGISLLALCLEWGRCVGPDGQPVGGYRYCMLDGRSWGMHAVSLLLGLAECGLCWGLPIILIRLSRSV